MVKPEIFAKYAVPILLYAVCWLASYVVLRGATTVGALVSGGEEGSEHTSLSLSAISFVAYIIWGIWKRTANERNEDIADAQVVRNRANSKRIRVDLDDL